MSNHPAQRVAWGRAAIVAGLATLIATLANTIWLFTSAQGGRVRETGYYFLTPLFVELGVNPFAHLPVWVSNYRDLTSLAELAAFLPVAFIGDLAFNLVIVAIPLAALAAWGRPRHKGAAPAMVGLICLAPAMLWPLDAWGMTATEWLLRDHMDLQRRLSLATRAGRIGSTGLVALVVMGLSVAALWGNRLGLLVRRSTELLAAVGKLVAVAAVILFAAGWMMRPAAPLPPLERAPNILLISIDTLRADRLSSYGHDRPTSPRLDQLAREGVRFETVVAPTSWTLPSHMSLMTGLDPLLTGVYVDTRSLPPATDTLALRLSALGYATGGVVSAGYLNAKWGFSRGFDYYDDFSVGKRHFGADKQEITSPQIIELANRWLDQWQRNHSNRPFFLFLHFYDVHYDFNPPPPYDTMFDPDYQGALTGLDFDTNPALKPGMPQEDLDHLLALYDGEIRHMDDQLGKLFDGLGERGVFDDTIVAVTSDHGEEFGEHGKFGHRETLYDEVLLIPLIMRYPSKIQPGVVVPDQVRLIDVGPTLLELAGTDATGFGAEGVDPLYQARTLVPLMHPEADPGPERLAFGDLLGGKLRSLRTSGVKYVIDREGREEVFELTTDPAEQRNLSGPEAEAAHQALSGLVESWIGFSESRGSQSKAVRASPQQIETLKSLGYIN